MQRLGLWGGYSSFKDFDSFVESIKGRGVGGLEMLAMEMKASGSYVCRGLSYREAEFELVEANITPEQQAVSESYR